MAAAASFNTEIDSISLGLILSQPGSGIPSTSTKGVLLPVVAFPRIKKLDPSSPGWPDRFMAVNPGIRPAREFDRLGVGARIISSPDMLAIDPVRVAFRCSP